MMSTGWWPSFSLPSSIQARFLSFALRRVLGHLLLPGQLDAEQINSQIGSGYVQVHQLRVDPAAVNTYISAFDLPFELVSGRVNSVIANVPWPNPLYSTVGLAIEGLHLVFHLAIPTASQLASSSVPVADSVASLSDSFIHDELSSREEKQLRESLLEPKVLSQLDQALDPFLQNPSSLGDHDPAGIPLFTSLIERLLSRFQFDAKDLRVDLEIPDRVRLTLSIGEVAYRDDSSTTSEDSSSKQRRITIDGIKVLCTDVRVEPNQPDCTVPTSTEGSATPSPTRSEHSEDLDEQTEMMMSQSLAFLPPQHSRPPPLKHFTSTPSSSRDQATSRVSPSSTNRDTALSDDSSSEDGSLYQSALTGTRFEDQTADTQQSHEPAISPSSQTFGDDADNEDEGRGHIIATFGGEPLVATLVMPLPPSRTVKVHIATGALAFALRPSHATLLSHFFAAFSASNSPSTSATTQSNPLFIDTTFTSKGLACLLLKDNSTLDAQFWAHPLSAKRPLSNTGYLRLSVSDIGFEQRDGESKAWVRDVSLFGFEQAQDGLLPTPLLISDPGLLHGSDQDRTQVKDWTDRRARAAFGSKLHSWRTKVKVDEANPHHLIRVTHNTGQSRPEISIAIGPIHLFTDLEYIRSCADFLSEFGNSDQPLSPDANEDEALFDDQARERRRLEKAVLKDLDLDLDYTLKKVPSKTSRAKMPERKTWPRFSMCFDFIRLQLRCPPPFGHPKPRSGALVVDLESVVISDADSVRGRRARFASGDSVPSNQLAALTCRKIAVGCTPPSAYSKSSQSPPTAKIDTYVVLSSLTETDQGESHSLEPSLRLSKLGKRTVVRMLIPRIGLDVDKPGIDLLQYLADDVTQFMESFTNTMDHSSIASRDASVIGSRYFVSLKGSGASSRAMLPTSPQKDEIVVEFEVMDTTADIHIPRSKKDQPHALQLVATDVHGVLESKPDGKDVTLMSLTVMGLAVTDQADTNSPVLMISLHKGRGMNRKSNPVINLKFTSINIPHTTAKESRVTLGLWDLLLDVHADVEQVNDIATFFKAPPGAFESVIPSERTSVTLSASECSLRISAPVHAGAAIVYIGNCSFNTDIVGGAEQSTYNLQAPHLEILFVDTCREVTDRDTSLAGREYWKSAGFTHIISMMELTLALHLRLGSAQQTKLHVDRLHLEVHLCADTAGELTAFLNDVVSVFKTEGPAEAPPSRKRVTVLAPPKIDLMASIEDLAFPRAPQVGPAADMINDDLPTNPEYLDESFGAAGGLRELLPEDLDDFPEDEDFTPSLPASTKGEGLISKIGGETIRMLQPGQIHVEENHFNVLPAEAIDSDPELNNSRVQVRVRDADLSLNLYEGFDWLKTRKTIEDETRNMRRKLARIKQLVAEGQTQDPSIESTNTVLFNSVYIGLEEDAENLSPQALLVAIDNELGQDEDLASQSSWQSFSPTPASGGVSAAPKRMKGRSQDLTRQKSASIEFHLRKSQVTFDQTTVDSPMASRMLLTVEDLEILDRMKSSTWEKFLTGLRSDSRGNVRETGSNMVRVELKKVRPAPGNPTEEARLRAKILPLRLYVDQDALDFLKKFFSFKDASPVASPNQPEETEDIYFQHVEVFPVDLKLDYKPRRVDYRALKEGRTIELMNFFHFDGAEMTLRHITLNGISGWPRMFDLLNDLWTPDVKATQLVEVISGVAPIRSVVNVGSGVADLILLPIEQYKKDGRVVRGVQKGAEAFMRSTATEVVKLGARLATGTQVILEQAEDALGGRSSNSITAEAMFSPINEEQPQIRRDGDSPLLSRYAEQPADLRQGMESAYNSLRTNLSSAAQTILAVPMEVYERQGDEGPVRSVIRAVPIAVIKPMIGATEAISKTLLGLHNTIDPNLRYENEAKYKHR